jgi:antitoxin HigA-1
MRSARAEIGELHSAGYKMRQSTSIWKIITEEDSMTKKLPKRGLPPMHPGELLREEILPALDRPKTEIARLLGVSRQTHLWLNLQKRYDLRRAAQELGEKLDAIPHA